MNAAKAYRNLEGLFAVYKMPNQTINSLIQQVNSQILTSEFFIQRLLFLVR